MSKLSAAAVMIAMLGFAGCSRDFAVSGISTGANFSKTGIITEPSTSYSFRFEKGTKMKDLFNYIYFEGDMLCFSADFTRDVQGEVSAYFTDPSSGKRFPAERIERDRSRVYGFSLVGSTLENFLRSSLEGVIPKERTIALPFVVTVIASNGGKQAVAETKGTLRVSF